MGTARRGKTRLAVLLTGCYLTEAEYQLGGPQFARRFFAASTAYPIPFTKPSTTSPALQSSVALSATGCPSRLLVFTCFSRFRLSVWMARSSSAWVMWRNSFFHKDRFPADFVFRLTNQELAHLKSQNVNSRSWGGRRNGPPPNPVIYLCFSV